MIAKVRKEIGKAKMKAEVEINRAANVQWVLDNRSDLTENYPNRWAAIDVGLDGPAVQFVDIEFFPVFKVMTMRESATSAIYYLCNDYKIPVMVVSPPEVWQYDTV
jgi:hypothetical protein